MAEDLNRAALILLAFYETKDGEIGYAWGGENKDRPAIARAEGNGWIVWHRDASVGGRSDPEGKPYQRRDIYRITATGRAALKAGLDALPKMQAGE